MILNDCVEF